MKITVTKPSTAEASHSVNFDEMPLIDWEANAHETNCEFYLHKLNEGYFQQF